MNTLAIVGAGPGLGLALARRFGAEGFAVALISRDQAHVAVLAETLTEEGIEAAGYAADVLDGAALRAALARAAVELGPVEVLAYTPVPSAQFLKPLADTAVEDYEQAIRFSLIGLKTAVDAVSETMRTAGRGTILLANGSSSVTPNGAVAGTSVGFAAEVAYATMLHDTAAGDGIHVGQLVIPGAIKPGDPDFAPDVLARHLWQMHVDRGDFRVTAGPATTR